MKREFKKWFEGIYGYNPFSSDMTSYGSVRAYAAWLAWQAATRISRKKKEK
jgi:hypothetical protein